MIDTIASMALLSTIPAARLAQSNIPTTAPFITAGVQFVFIVGIALGKRWAFWMTMVFCFVRPILMFVVMVTASFVPPGLMSEALGTLAYLPLGIYCLLRLRKWDPARPDGLRQ